MPFKLDFSYKMSFLNYFKIQIDWLTVLIEQLWDKDKNKFDLSKRGSGVIIMFSFSCESEWK